ncbi:MAG: septal ring lytic transglycosylase RlpA family protein [Nitrospirae bacterium]|nr:septal ring lytic transglycosylase RlpA family protein [Candidatus Troglogloeales bacterium]MBI3598809.1 septal ring lytic transglycosylase RlpA family protein [Candidatus Troglogloeales bacterium]
MKKLFLFVVFILIINGCATVPAYKQGYRTSGLASWYGSDFHGKKTSSGETYDMYGLTAAHRTLPFGTMLRVTDPTSGRAVNVRVNDRGPFVPDRILDLSYGAAQSLGTVGRGVTAVAIEVVSLGLDRGVFLVQLGTFSVPENADRVKQKAEQYYRKVYIEPVEHDRRLYRVRIGPFESREEAESVARQFSIKTNGLETVDPVVIRAD